MAEKRSRTEVRQSKKGSKRKNASISSIFKKGLIAFFIIGIMAMIVGAITFFALVKDAPPLDEALLKDPVSSKVLDMNGKKITEIGVEKRTYASYQDIPKLMEHAFLSVEDIRFYKHHGVDLRRLVGAVIANFKDGFGAEGASTITQQVIKNSFLSPEKTVKRKVQEQWLALRLEQKYSKEQIFEMYVNKIYLSVIPSFGQIYGVSAAAEAYFGKELNELELHEIALIAGMPQSPNNYNPFNHPQAAEDRRNTVLALMAKQGFISKVDADVAMAIPVTSSLVKTQKDPRPYDAFIDQVLKEVAQLGDGDVDVASAGLEIYTTLDPNAQTYVEQALNTDDIVQYPNENFQASIVLLDTKTGAVRAIGGGRNFEVSGFNYATDIERQPGSTIKPITDYGPAIEHLQWSTYHQIVDEPYSYKQGQAIKNYDGKFKGQMSIREALADSRNIPALKTFHEVGSEYSREFASNLGMQVKDTLTESDALGGGSIGASPMTLAGAFSAFGNKGLYNKPHTVTKVVFMDGTSVNLKQNPVNAMKESTAFMITDMMKSVVTSGTGRSANIPGLNVAGKTGTTNFSTEERETHKIKNSGVKDIWFVGYTPQYTAAVWTGYEKTTETTYISSNPEKAIAKQLFKAVVKKVSGKESGDFERPNSVVKVAVEKGTNPAKIPSEFTPDDQIVNEYFLKGTEPTEISDVYKKLEAPTDLSASYDRGKNEITLKWNYPDELREGISFEVQYSVDEGPFQLLRNVTELGLIVQNPIPEAIYKFRVTAFHTEDIEKRSDSVDIVIQIPAKLEDEIDLIPDDEIDDGDEPLIDIIPDDKDKDTPKIGKNENKDSSNN